MKRLPFLTAFFALSIFAKGQFPKFEWAVKIGDNGDDVGRAIFADLAGNTYTTGHFSGTVDFDPGNGNFELKSAGDVDIFVTKFDKDGNFIWARSMGGTAGEEGRSIAVDISGSVYITGTFSGTVDFDPDTFKYNLSASGVDIFIEKLDANGLFMWAKKIGASGTDLAASIAVDGFGNVYITGSFFWSMDFDPGPGSFIMSARFDKSDIFILKLKSNGSFLWAKNIGGQSWDEGMALAVDPIGNVYSTGYFQTLADFDPGVGTTNLTATGDDDIYLLKLDSAGQFVWANKMGGKFRDDGTCVGLDDKGNVFVAGFFQDTVDFDPGAGIVNMISNGANDIFISKFDTSGKLGWTKSIGGVANDFVYSLAVDASGSVFATGHFSETVDFDPGAVSYSLKANGGTDIFILKLDAVGRFVWVKSIGGTSYDYGASIDLDLSGYLYTTGYFGGTTDFDPGTDSFKLYSSGSYDIFVHKMNVKTGTINKTNLDDFITVYPNPVSSILNIVNSADEKNMTISLIDMKGKVVITKHVSFQINTIDTSDLSDGLYIIKIANENGIVNGKILVRH